MQKIYTKQKINFRIKKSKFLIECISRVKPIYSYVDNEGKILNNSNINRIILTDHHLYYEF